MTCGGIKKSQKKLQEKVKKKKTRGYLYLYYNTDTSWSLGSTAPC